MNIVSIIILDTRYYLSQPNTKLLVSQLV